MGRTRRRDASRRGGGSGSPVQLGHRGYRERYHRWRRTDGPGGKSFCRKLLSFFFFLFFRHVVYPRRSVGSSPTPVGLTSLLLLGYNTTAAAPAAELIIIVSHVTSRHVTSRRRDGVNATVVNNVAAAAAADDGDEVFIFMFIYPSLFRLDFIFLHIFFDRKILVSFHPAFRCFLRHGYVPSKAHVLVSTTNRGKP